MAIQALTNYFSQARIHLTDFLKGTSQTGSASPSGSANSFTANPSIDIRIAERKEQDDASSYFKRCYEGIFGKALADTFQTPHFSSEDLDKLKACVQRNGEAYKSGLEKSIYFEKFKQINQFYALVPEPGCEDVTSNPKQMKTALLVKVEDRSGSPNPMEAIRISHDPSQGATIYYRQNVDRYFPNNCQEYLKDILSEKPRGHLEKQETGFSFGSYAMGYEVRVVEGSSKNTEGLSSISLAKS